MIPQTREGRGEADGVRYANIAQIIMIPYPRNRREAGDSGMRIGG